MSQEFEQLCRKLASSSGAVTGAVYLQLIISTPTHSDKRSPHSIPGWDADDDYAVFVVNRAVVLPLVMTTLLLCQLAQTMRSLQRRTPSQQHQARVSLTLDLQLSHHTSRSLVDHQ